MGRRHTKAQLHAVCDKLRERIPEICLRTTLITGFPGETEEEFQEMCEFIQEVQFDRLGVFAYSQEEDTPAALMKNQIDEEEKQRRKDLLMQLQQEISLDLNSEKVGRELTVMVEGKSVDEDVYVCRTSADAPDVDSYLFLNTGMQLMSGDFIRARVTEAGEYDLIGVPADEEY